LHFQETEEVGNYESELKHLRQYKKILHTVTQTVLYIASKQRPNFHKNTPTVPNYNQNMAQQQIWNISQANNTINIAESIDSVADQVTEQSASGYNLSDEV